jgi:hypothetical protein
MYVVLPATLGVRPRGLRLATVQYWVQLLAIAGLALTMSLAPRTWAHVLFGLLTLAALVIFAHNIAATVGRGRVWHLPEAHFVMAIFYLAITGLIGMSFVFYLKAGAVPQTMTHLKVHAHFAGIGWLALTTMGLTYKLLPLELGLEQVPRRWGVAASVLINVVFWGVFLSYAYDRPALRLASAVLAWAGLTCHSLQVWTMARMGGAAPQFREALALNLRALFRPSTARGDGTSGGERPLGSVRFSQAACCFGGGATLLAILTTMQGGGHSVASEYASAYAAGAGWFGLSLVGQTLWLLPLLQNDVYGHVAAPTWTPLAFWGPVVGTCLVTIGLALGTTSLVATGAALNLIASVLVTGRSLYGWRTPPVMVES